MSDALLQRVAPIARDIANRFSKLQSVQAVAVAGSWRGAATDRHSDIDLYVYSDLPPAVADRARIAQEFGTQVELDNQYWEPGDEWIARRSGITIDVMYRAPAWIEAELDRVLVEHQASIGYSTCFWHNVLTAEPLFDRSGWFADLQARATQPYPNGLKRAIIAKNHPILRDAIASYLHQIEAALARRDLVSVQHRIAALIASYFDILFALNETPHPGEKRLLELARRHCTKVPPGMEDAIASLIGAGATTDDPAEVLQSVHALIDPLDVLLIADDLLPPVQASLHASNQVAR